MNKFIGSISHFFANNRSLSMLLLVATLLFGIVAFSAMPKQYNPEIIRPAFLISFSYNNATPEEAINRVAIDLVEKIQTIPNVDDIYTTISDGATISTTVIFAVGTDIVSAKTNLRAQIDSYSYLATGNISDVTVREINPETIPVMQIALSAHEHSVQTIRNEAFRIRQVLLAISGVSEITVQGGGQPALIVEVDPIALSTHNVSITTIQDILGTVGTRHVNPGYETTDFTVASVIDNVYQSPAEIALLPISSDAQIQNVARVYEGVTPVSQYTLSYQKGREVIPTVIIGVAKREGASAPRVTDAVKSALEDIIANSDIPLHYEILADDGATATKEIDGLTKNLVTSILIVAVVLLLFLSTRAAVVVLITIPVTFLIVVGIGFIAGETINRITLFALILSLGLLVDSSIVVVDIIYENLKRATAQGRRALLPRIAADAVSEVGPGLILSAITSVVVFLPMNFITGMMGPYMGPISFFVPTALIVSLFIAIMLAPFIAIAILRTEERQWALQTQAQSVITKITNQYTKIIRRLVNEQSLRKKLLWGTGGIFILALGLPLSGLVHFQMLPKADRDQIYLYVDLPVSSGREVTRALTDEAAAIALNHPDVLSLHAFIATRPIIDFNGLFKGAQNRTAPEQATVRINLTPATERKKSSTAITKELRFSLASSLSENSQYLRLMEEPPGPPVRATFEAKITTDTTPDSDRLIHELSGILKNVTGVVDIYDSTEPPQASIHYEFDHLAAQAAGATSAETILWHKIVSGQYQVQEIIAPSYQERTPLILTTPIEFRSTPDLFLSIPLAHTHHGETIGSFVTPTYTAHNPKRSLEGVTPVSYLTAELEGRSIVYVMIEMIHHIITQGVDTYTVTSWGLFGMTLENNDGEIATITWGGEWEMTLENFRDLGLAMMIALALVYSILVAQYRSFSTPALILVTVPLGLIGILFGFFILDQTASIYLTATALIGFIALIGIVVNNAIIYLEYVVQVEKEGLTFADALVAAGTLRLRPILLTSLTTVLGSLTIANDPVWSGLAWSIIFGLSLSTFLTLVILPSFLAATHTPQQE